MKSLPDRFIENLRSLGIYANEHNILLAVSGGIDSMVMLNLFYRCGYNCVVAHCNFGLRGEASDAEEELVKRTSAQYRFPFHAKLFPTQIVARERGISIQMAARELRYEWFAELKTLLQLDFIATAHHADDVAETMLINLVRGTGIAGMHGISEINTGILRPLLFATRNDLENYAAKQKLAWKNDASNEENYYKRNKIRNLVMPILKELNPSVSTAMANHAAIMEDYEKLLSYFLRTSEPGLTTGYFGNTIHTIALKKLNLFPAPQAVLYHLLKPYGVPSGFSGEILASGTGAEFLANGYRFIRDRDELTIFSPDVSDENEYTVEPGDKELSMKYGKIHIHKSELVSGTELSSLPGFGDRSVAYLNADALKFPLTLRKWRAGDRFQPLGMQGTRLISDYFTDEKFSSAMKEIVYLLLSDNRVVWIAGHRIAEPYRLHPETTRTTCFTFLPNS